MEQLIKKAKTIKSLGITTVTILPIAIILVIMGAVLAFSYFYIGMALLWTGVGLSILVCPIALTSSILILTTKWENKELDDCKTLWGILDLFVIPGIAAIVFSIKACNEYASN